MSTEAMDVLRVSIVQTDIVWENKRSNLQLLRQKLKALCGTTEVVVLPEMFSTAFSMENHTLAEPICGETITTLKKWAAELELLLIGSYMATDNGQYYNRAFFLTPQGDEYYYDKRHLFGMGGEQKYFAAGDRKSIIHYRGWNICMLVCYDLRFPVWSRNVHNEYDLLIYVANWPDTRRMVWDTLLRARALENMSYVCGVNRVGNDNLGNHYNGGSIIYSPRGETLATVPDDTQGSATTSLSLSFVQQFRNKFPAWKDADTFHLTNKQTYENKS